MAQLCETPWHLGVKAQNMHIIFVALLFFQIVPASPLLENDFVRVFRNSAPCAGGATSCGDRVVVALSSVELSGQKMERDDIKVFEAGEHYSPPESGDYLEVVIKPGHPKEIAPSAGTPLAPDNKILYDGKQFTIFEEKMQPGETSSTHSHNQRLAIFLNRTQVQQWTDGKSETRELVPDVVTFRPAVVHMSKDVGNVPIRNILIEFKP
jgi:quercetin dioxygenase-like cupin family protein